MCLTLPAKVLTVSGQMADIEYNGRIQKVKIGSADALSAGDFVLFTGDYLIKKIDQAEAEEINALLGSYRLPAVELAAGKLRDILEKSTREKLSAADLSFLLSLEDEADLQALYSQANITRKTSIKDHICIHGIIEFSNYCKNNCGYCGLRCENGGKRYRMTAEEIIEASVEAVNGKGYKLLVLQSGEDDHFATEDVVRIITEIKQRCRVFLYLSIGDRSRDDYRQFKQAGANGVLYRFETSNPELYAKLHSNDSINDRLENLRMFKELGYVISTGNLIGLPGQTASDLAQDIITIEELGTFMPSFGPLVPAQNTPLADCEIVDFRQILKFCAALRLYLPTARIPVTTAMETLYGGESARQQCFMAGANAVMFNLTPDRYRENYNIYDNKFFDREKKYERWALFKGELSYEMMERELGFQI